MANKQPVASFQSSEYDELVALLRETREAAGISQLKLAKLLGQSEAYIRKIEDGERRIDVVEFYLVARTLSLNPTELFDRFVKRIQG